MVFRCVSLHIIKCSKEGVCDKFLFFRVASCFHVYHKKWQQKWQQLMNVSRRKLNRTDSNFWLKKVKPRGGSYVIRFLEAGRRVWVTFPVSTKHVAAEQASLLFRRAEVIGLDAALREQRGETERPATVGELISAYTELAGSFIKPASLADYSAKLRKIAADIAKLAPKSSKYHPNGEWRREVDQIPLSLLTEASIQGWISGFINPKGKSPEQQNAAKQSVVSFVRSARSFWSKDWLPKLSKILVIPENPWLNLVLPERTRAGYESSINANALLSEALEELDLTDNDACRAIVLGLGAGLRRAEADMLTWEQFIPASVDAAGIPSPAKWDIRPVGERTLKSQGSRGRVPLSPLLASIFERWRLDDASPQGFVLRESVASKGKAYRAAAWPRVIAWLRAHGVQQEMAFHALRKEVGSILAQQHGIYAASKFLRHSSVQVTQAVYVEPRGEEAPAFEVLEMKQRTG